MYEPTFEDMLKDINKDLPESEITNHFKGQDDRGWYTGECNYQYKDWND
jgi:hypothetical protein